MGKWLKYPNNLSGNISVVTNELIETVVDRLDKYFAEKQHIAYVTSGVRTPEDQLRLIRKYCIDKGVDKDFPEILTCELYSRYENVEFDVVKTVNLQGLVFYGGMYKWQYAWSRLLNIGIIINPPLTAMCLFDYYKNGKNLKGIFIPPSPHIAGTAIDIGGGDNLVADEVEIISGAMARDRELGVKNIVIERNNNCVHLNLK